MELQPPCFETKKSAVHVEIFKKIYPLDAVLFTVYHFIDDFYIFVRPGKGGSVVVEMKSKKNKIAKSKLEAVAGEFYNVLLAETLRRKLSNENKKFREEILVQAVASALSPPSAEEQAAAGDAPPSDAEELELDAELKKILERTKNVSYADDPLGIALPVEESDEQKKKLKKKKKAAKKKKSSPKKKKKTAKKK